MGDRATPAPGYSHLAARHSLLWAGGRAPVLVAVLSAPWADLAIREGAAAALYTRGLSPHPRMPTPSRRGRSGFRADPP